MFHMSSGAARCFDYDIRDFVAAVSPLIASVVDVAEPFTGEAASTPVRWIGIDDPPVPQSHSPRNASSSVRADRCARAVVRGRRVAAHRICPLDVRFRAGRCYRQPGPAPYRLTWCVLEIATALVSGLPNKVIGLCSADQPTHRGQTCRERILEKLACSLWADRGQHLPTGRHHRLGVHGQRLRSR